MRRETAEPIVDDPPGEASRKWIDAHRAVAAPGEHSQEFVWNIAGDARGPFVTDLDGDVVSDFTCHVGAAPLGYDDPKILDELREFDLVDPPKTAGRDCYFGGGTVEDPEFPGSTRLMQRPVDASSQYGTDTVFLSNSGVEAVENEMRVAYDACGSPKYGFTFTGSFHGRTVGTLSLTRSRGVHTRKYPEVADD